MRFIRYAVVCILALMTLSASACAEDLSRAGEAAVERGFFSDPGETPEEIIISAMEIYSWFTIAPLDVDPELPSGDGSGWRVADEALCDYEVVTSLLDFTFSEEIVGNILMYDTYTVIDGLLYGTAGGRSIDPRIGEVVYEETFSSDEKIVYTATVKYLEENENIDDPEVFEFVREKIDGHWVFTEFPFFW